MIDGLAVNTYAEPLVSLDLDPAVAVDSLDDLEKRLAKQFTVKRFLHSLNISPPSSDLRLQIQTDVRYRVFVVWTDETEILGMRLPVTNLDDVLQGKIWAAPDP